MQLGELAQALGLALEGEPGVELRGLAGLEDAGPEELSFVSGDRYRKAFTRSRAGAFLVPPDFDAEKRPCLRSPAPYADFGRAVELFLPPPLRPEPVAEPGLSESLPHATAAISPIATSAASHRPRGRGIRFDMVRSDIANTRGD